MQSRKAGESSRTNAALPGTQSENAQPTHPKPEPTAFQKAFHKGLQILTKPYKEVSSYVNAKFKLDNAVPSDMEIDYVAITTPTEDPKVWTLEEKIYATGFRHEGVLFTLTTKFTAEEREVAEADRQNFLRDAKFVQIGGNPYFQYVDKEPGKREQALLGNASVRYLLSNILIRSSEFIRAEGGIYIHCITDTVNPDLRRAKYFAQIWKKVAPVGDLAHYHGVASYRSHDKALERLQEDVVDLLRQSDGRDDRNETSWL